MIALFGGGLAITSTVLLPDVVAWAPIALGAAACCFGALVLYGAHVRRRG
jgi:hypothetical protein